MKEKNIIKNKMKRVENGGEIANTCRTQGRMSNKDITTEQSKNGLIGWLYVDTNNNVYKIVSPLTLTETYTLLCFNVEFLKLKK